MFNIFFPNRNENLLVKITQIWMNWFQSSSSSMSKIMVKLCEYFAIK